MVLDLENPGIKARISGLSGGRTRLVIEYPTEQYRDTVLTALADMLRPAPSSPPRRSAHAQQELGE